MKSHLYRVGQRFAFKVATCPEAGPDTRACKSQNAEKCQKHGMKIVLIWVNSVSPLSGGLLQSHFMSCHLQNKSSVRRRQTSSSVWRKEYAAAHKMRERERERASVLSWRLDGAIIFRSEKSLILGRKAGWRKGSLRGLRVEWTRWKTHILYIMDLACGYCNQLWWG